METNISEGDVLRAETTGRTYEVKAVYDGKVWAPGLPPVSKAQLKRDIKSGKVTRL